jgi:hypothetical protein
VNEAELKGGWHMETIKFFKSRLFLKVKKNTFMKEIYGRVAKLIGINPGMIRLRRKLLPNNRKSY